MRRSSRALALCVVLGVVAVATPASAQMPPSIKGPIDAAKRQANKTSDQIRNEQKVGDDARSAQMPAASAQAAAQGAAQKSGATRQAPPPPAVSAATAAAAAKAQASADSAKKRGSVSQSGGKGTMTFYREVFTYHGDGRRDPFLSLMATGELRPMVSDLRLVGIIYDQSGRNSVAILVDATPGGQVYRKKVGDMLGRIKVSKITENDITVNVEEFGFSRQETLLIDRNPRTGARRPQ